ncbi:MAG: hypothetical protein RLY16_30 [Bacteroidota bacterium]|jgi:hypothetical protein
MANDINKSSSSFRSLVLLHRALLAGQVVMGVMMYYLRSTSLNPPFNLELDRILQAVAIALAAIAYLVGTKWFFTKKIKEARESNGSTADKFAIYRTASLVQWALLEGTTLFAIVAFYLTGNLAFLVMAGMLVLIFALLMPSVMKIAILLRASEQEIRDL